jgi:uncharacterized integral membrane protein
MSLRLGVALLLAALLAVFVGVNWSAFIAPATLSILIATVQAPLGLVMLGVLGLVVLLFATYMAWWQGRILLDTRRHTKELQSQRELADKAEASRFTDLSSRLDSQIAALGTRLNQRIDERTQELRIEIQHSANGVAASLGELEDRLERGKLPSWEPTQPG